jgi:ketosteroid isomerase-like protein
MGAAENKATVAAAYEAFGRGDVEAVINTNAPDAVWVIHSGGNSPLDGEHKGLDGIGAFFQTINDSIEISRFEMTPIAAEGDIVVATGDQEYTVKATGKTVRGPLVHVFTFGADGKCIRFEEFESNTEGAFIQ